MIYTRRVVAGLFLVSLAACGGSESTYVGAVAVEPDAVGVVEGIEAGSLTVVQTDIGGFVFGLAENVDTTRIGNSAGASAGDLGSFAVSGLLPESNLGTAYDGGTATYTGAYRMVVLSGYEDTSNAADWNRQDLGGDITAEIDFHEADLHLDPDHDPDHDHSFDEVLITAQSDDGILTFDDVVIYQPQLPALPSTVPGTFTGGVAKIDGDNITLDGEIAFGADGMVASFRGADATSLVAGGFALDGDGFTDPDTE